MKIIVGHTNIDLDCIGSMVLARYLYPEHTPVMSRLIHPAARNVINLYRYHLNYTPSEDLKGQAIESAVIVDTRSASRVKEYFEHTAGAPQEIIVYDHHSAETCDFPGATVYQGDYGSNTTMLCLKLIEQNIRVSERDATIALTGIYADTGNFTHDNVTRDDFAAASYLLAHGADIKLTNNFLKSLREEYQLSLFHEIMNTLVWQDINGHQIVFSYYAMEKQNAGLAAVVEEIFNIENPDAMFGVFHFDKPKCTLIIARSRKNVIDLTDILRPFGGGGHTKAASALVKQGEGKDVFRTLLEYLTAHLEDAVTARDIMSSEVLTVNEDWTLIEASKFFEDHDISGAPVMKSAGEPAGMLTLRDIMNGRKNGRMSSPVKAYMRTKLVTCEADTTAREIENLMFINGIGHLPVMENGRLAGIITRADMLKFLQHS